MAKAVTSRTRSISISRVLEFFRTGNADEVRAVMPLVIEAVGARHLTINAGPAISNAAGSTIEVPPKQKRHRRTRAEMEQARLNSAAARESALANGPDELVKAEGA